MIKGKGNKTTTQEAVNQMTIETEKNKTKKKLRIQENHS